MTFSTSSDIQTTPLFVFGTTGGDYFSDGRGPHFVHISGSSDDLHGFIAQVLASQREFADRIRAQRRSEVVAHQRRPLTRVEKLRILAERGATAGERAAARAALIRIGDNIA